ncbi:hypothetical protein AAFX91_32690 [Bradyrhizobium sp. 31Argb]|uniref:hypothetical protein n=1 Tax=unclassified Bradyrhizobium TaxID=2631580 RepID=UPI0010297ACA|nr:MULTISPECIES: hypothetical protein [unclassified Bradyrhizobium]RZN14250.1 hypothetical protein CWO90_43350 [Bradyrhizobium sp. Leo121]
MGLCPDGGTKVQAALTRQDPGELHYGAHGMVEIGEMGFSSDAYIPSQLPTTPKIGLVPVMIHELAHQLGIASTKIRHFLLRRHHRISLNR